MVSFRRFSDSGADLGGPISKPGMVLPVLLVGGDCIGGVSKS